MGWASLPVHHLLSNINNTKFMIIRLEKLIPAKLDEPTQQRLLNELFENSLQNQVKEVLKPSVAK
ncbi:hypothetical protein NIES2101_35195 [Calothrix sp. HK-06]|nr:hypothetical protein NIES2101_35195 [Calothrix sp. HK-06]